MLPFVTNSWKAFTHTANASWTILLTEGSWNQNDQIWTTDVVTFKTVCSSRVIIETERTDKLQKNKITLTLNVIWVSRRASRSLAAISGHSITESGMPRIAKLPSCSGLRSR